jgi:hypothetical protein
MPLYNRLNNTQHNASQHKIYFAECRSLVMTTLSTEA